MCLCFLLLTLIGNAGEEYVDSTGYKNYYLQEIQIVSNPKSESKLLEFPASITVFNTRNIEDCRIISLKDLSTLSPNFYVPDYGSKLISSVYIRGIGSRINSPVIGLYVDNVPYLDKSAFDFDFMDIEKVEVLKGPQGTLYGRNTMAGLVNIYTRSPFDYQGTKIRGGYGNGNAWSVALSHSYKVNEKFAFSLNGRYRKDDGYFMNEYTGEKSGTSEVVGGRGQLQWRINRRLKINISSDFEYSRQNGYPYSKYDKFEKRWEKINYNDEASYKRNLSTTSLFVQYTHECFVMSSTSGYQYLKDNMHLDQDFTPLSVFTLQQKQKQNAFTQEVVFKSSAFRNLQWVAGIFGFYSGLRTDGPVNFKKDGISYLIEGQTNTQLSALKVQYPKMPDLSLDIDNYNLYINGTYQTPTFGLAVFKQLVYNNMFTNGLSGTIGLRLDYENSRIKHNTYSTDNLRGNISGQMTVVRPSVIGGDLVIPILIPLDIPLSIEGKERMDMWELLPKFELKYKIGKSSVLYLSAARGYRSGGYNFQMFSNLIQSQIREKIMQTAFYQMPSGIFPEIQVSESMPMRDIIAYRPEHSWNYEIGGHSVFGDNRIFADISAFYIDCRNQQISVVSGYGRITKNSGRSVSKGIEASFRYVPMDNFQFSVSYGFTHACFVSNNDGEIDYKHNYVPFTPKHTLAITGGYSIPVNCSWLDKIDIDLQYLGRGRIYWTELNDVSQPYYELVNGSFSFTKGPFNLKIWGKNIFNRRYQSFYFEVMNAQNLKQDNGFAQKGRPVTFGTDVTIRF